MTSRAPGLSPAELSSPLRLGLALLAIGALSSGVAQRWDRPVLVVLALAGGSVLALALDADRPAPVLRSPLLLWVGLFLAATAGWGLWRTAVTPATDQAIVDRFRSMALLVAMAVVFDDARARRTGAWALVAVAAFSSFVNVAEALGAVTFPDEPGRTLGRVAGLYVNPNGAGMAIVFALAAGLEAVPRALRAPALLVGASGVAVTFSRGAATCLLLVVAIALWRRALPAWQAVLVLGLAAAAALVGGALLVSGLDSGGALTDNNLARLAFTADDSGRGALAARAWAQFLDAPWLGHGVAIERAGRVSHNMYLALAVEHGVLGLLAYPAFAVALAARNPAGLATAAVCLVGAFTSHNLLDSEPALICCALAAARPRRAAAAPAPQAPAAARSRTRTVALTRASTE